MELEYRNTATILGYAKGSPVDFELLKQIWFETSNELGEVIDILDNANVPMTDAVLSLGIITGAFSPNWVEAKYLKSDKQGGFANE